MEEQQRLEALLADPVTYQKKHTFTLNRNKVDVKFMNTLSKKMLEGNENLDDLILSDTYSFENSRADSKRSRQSPVRDP